jgi:hypothetical protein
MSIFLDTNIFMYAAGKPHQYKAPCVRILRDLEQGRLRAVINTEILQEILYRYSHIGLPDKGIDLCRTLLQYPLSVFAVTEADLRTAIDLFDQFRTLGIQPRDAIHAATMQNNNLTRIITVDMHFDHFGFLGRIDPLSYT